MMLLHFKADLPPYACMVAALATVGAFDTLLLSMPVSTDQAALRLHSDVQASRPRQNDRRCRQHQLTSC